MQSKQVVLVTGDTGSGKTTQLVQYLLEEAAHNKQTIRMICCQPRRLTAVTVAERIAAERGEKVGGTIGYQIRLESSVSTRTLATFCTYGVLLRSLCGGLDILESLTHIIIDEIHERDSMSDFLITVLRDALIRFRHLKLVLMSATVDTKLFLSYFPGCVHISLDGRMFPVEEFYLENILMRLNYKTKEMEKMKKSGLSNRSATTIEELSTKLSTISVPCVENDDVIVEDAETVLENEVDVEMDRILEECFLVGEEAQFRALQERLIRDGESLVNYSHSVTGVTALMASASRGNTDIVELCLQLGAESGKKLTNGWTALECARLQNQEECVKMLEEYTQLQGRTVGAGAGSDTNMSQEEKELLDLYYACVDQDTIDHDLILKILVMIHRNQPAGAVLVFLPGYEDISIMYEMVSGEPALSKDTSVVILHSQIGSSESKKAFQPPPRGSRKIVLATNVAETGVTIPDIVYVVDTGKVKLKSFDSLTNTSMLKAEWISRTSATQRKGRAGRCQPGQVYRLFSSTMQASMAQFTTPEILRTSLLSLCLQTKLLAAPNTPIADFLAKVPDPPPFLITRNAVQNLKTMEALDTWEEITPLGLHLLDIPLDPWLGKILLHAVMLKCLDPVLTITCMLAYRSPFILSIDPRSKKEGDASKRRLASNTGSDHMSMLRAFQEWQHARIENRERRWCRANQVSPSTMEMVVGMRNQVLAQLRASGFVKSRGSGDIRNINSNSDNWALVKACLLSGLYPNIIRVDREAGVLRTQRESKVRLAPGSVMKVTPGTMRDLASDWMVYEEMSRVGRTAFVRGVTPVSPLAVALFGGSGKAGREGEGITGNIYLEETSDSETEDVDTSGHSSVMVDPWIVFSARPGTASQISQLRQKWTGVWSRRLVTTNKQARVGLEEQDDIVVSCIAELLVQDDNSLGLVQPPGIGQRPKHLAVDLTTGQPTQLNPRRKPSDSAASSTSEDNDLIQLSPGMSRYFIVRPSAGSLNALEAAMSHPAGVWSFPTLTERKLMAAALGGEAKVIAIFCVQNTGGVQGAAVFTGEQQTQGGRSGVMMEWLHGGHSRGHLPLMLSNLGVRLEASRDGQELDPATGQSVLASLAASHSQAQGGRRLDRGGYR